jgi:amino acid transporter
MADPSRSVLKAMFIAIGLVALLYVATSVAVLGNLPLSEVIRAKDYALAEAAKPIFGAIGFKIMAATALLATASAINAALYAATEIGYTLAKEGNLPRKYTYNVFRSYEGLIISALLIVPMVLFLNLAQVTTIAALVVLMIQGIVHLGHLFRLEHTGANGLLVFLAAVAMFAIAGLTLYRTSETIPDLDLYLSGAFLAAGAVEIALRLVTKRILKAQIDSRGVRR